MISLREHLERVVMLRVSYTGETPTRARAVILDRLSVPPPAIAPSPVSPLSVSATCQHCGYDPADEPTGGHSCLNGEYRTIEGAP